MKIYTSELLNLPVETMNSIVEDLLQGKSNLSLPYRSVFVIRSLYFFKMLSSDFLILIKRDCLADWKSGQWRRKWVVVSIRKQPSRGVLRKRCSENTQHIYRRTHMPTCGFNKVSKQLYWNNTSAWVFSGKFAAYFQNTLF